MYAGRAAPRHACKRSPRRSTSPQVRDGRRDARELPVGLSVAEAKGLKRTFFDAFPLLGRFGEQLKQRCREVSGAAWGGDGLTDGL